MKVLDAALDSCPTAKKVSEFAELRIENLLCFKELQSFNDTGKWLYEHPLIKHQSEIETLKDLKRKDPEEFLRRYEKCSYSIKRYSSYLKRTDRKDKHNTDLAHLKRYQELVGIFKTIIENDN